MASRKPTARASYPKHQRRQKQQAIANGPAAVLHKLVDQSDNPALLLELHYWSQEKELAGLMRNYLQIPQPSRLLLSTFFDLAKADPASVDAKVRQNGDVVLSSAAVSDLLKVLNQKLQPTIAWQDQAEAVH